ncbi:MAG: ethanolamine ammonia-lyase subunit EutC [Clostridia bacterium]|nr:ethanolamine ammonia-lyase subunit EutC [Clostridia bacterium]
MYSLNKNSLETNITDIPMQEFCQCETASDYGMLEELKESTPARIGSGHCGARYKTLWSIRFQADQYAAADAVLKECPNDVAQRLGMFEIQTRCRDKYEMLTRPDLGRLFDENTQKIISEKCVHNPDVQIFVGDGLCSPSVMANVPDMLPTIKAALEFDGIKMGTPFFVRYCRVNTVRTVAEILKPKVTAVLIGERPGMLTAKSMSAYIAYNAGYNMSESDYNVVSNISSDGMSPVEAAAYIVDIIKAMLEQKVSGYGLKL